MNKNKIIIYSPRQWDLQWGQEKDLINAINKKYKSTLIELPDYQNLKKNYASPKNTEIVYVKTKVKDTLLLGAITEIRNVFYSLKFKHDIIITYLTAGTLLTTLLSRLRGKKILLIYADDLPELNKKKSYLAYVLTKFVFNPITALLSNKIIVTAKLLGEDLPCKEKTTYIPNGVDVSYYASSITDAPSKQNLVFIGGFGEWVDFDLIISFARKNPDIQILLIGDGKLYKEIKQKSARLKNVKLTGMLDREKVKDELKKATACIIPFKVNRLTDRVSPIKLFEYWAMKKPVISTKFYEINITGHDAVLFIDDEKDLKVAMQKLEDKSFSKNLAERGYVRVKNYDWKKIGERYLKIIEDL